MLHFRNSLKQALQAGIIDLVDSGNGERLERIGDYLLRRPSSQAIWQHSLSTAEWKSAQARYIPQKGWTINAKSLPNWQITLADMHIKLLLQDNGQIGIFPEHLCYFADLSIALENLAARLERPARVLNLFAYTGLASIWCALHGAEVTHVELSKKVLTWAKDNLQLNPNLNGSIRFIPEDALAFLEREVRRQSHYDLIIADPPSFSRISKSQSWDLEDIAAQLVASLTRTLNPLGQIFLTSHHPVLNAYTFENLFRDQQRKFHFERRDLIIIERLSNRTLPCGSLIIAKES